MNGGERYAELNGELNFNYQEFSEGLIPEWQDVANRLGETGRGVEVLNDPGFRDYLARSSDTIDTIDKQVSQPNFDPTDLTALQLRKMYYDLPSLVEMKERPHILAAIGQGLEAKLPAIKNKETLLLRKRRLASVFEELSVITQDQASLDYALKAYELNREVSESSLELATSPRKMHARFAYYDIFLRRLVDRYDSTTDFEGHVILSKAHDAQRNYHFELAEALATIRVNDIEAEAVSGSIGELLVLGRIREKLFNEERLFDTEASQSFIRQDTSKKSKLDRGLTWKWTYDLSLKNRTTNKEVPIEVKKRSVGSRLNGRPNSYVPLVEVVQFRLGRDKGEYLQLSEQYSSAKYRQLSGKRLSGKQQSAVESFENIIDPEIDRVFEKLDSSQELATDYQEARNESPRLHEFAGGVALST